MAARLQASLLAVAVIAAAAAALTTPASGANYTVGAPGGSWDLQTDLADWASSIAFRPGDQLLLTSPLVTMVSLLLVGLFVV
ncbi:hypothetical protein C2845_PM13G02500 [Panicum miliaceum]|uniref:Phytocyanin domain-containing protein n=1 Tax=Panicum miliaceum TaxID=4540 RepID=A0A3L6RHR4_PANMI|nr:hypothetical protein C2845_PM13G02500 [Panicum miliaceum]